MLFFFPQIHAHIDWTLVPEFLDKELQKILPNTHRLKPKI